MDTLDESEACEGLEGAEPDLLAYLTESLLSLLDSRERSKRGEAAQRELAIGALPLFESLPDRAVQVRVSNPQGSRAGRTVLELLIADQPFLADTFRMTLRRLGLREMILIHPLLAIERHADGSIARIGKSSTEGRREAYLYAETTRVEEAGECDRIASELRRVFTQLSDVVADHRGMLKALRRHMAELEFVAPVLAEGRERTSELVSFLDWLADDNYVFFGYRYYRVHLEGDSWRVELDHDSSLGMLGDAERSRFREALEGAEIPLSIRSRLADERLVFFDKSRSESTIHREGRLDVVSIKVLDERGRLAGFGTFMGLLTFKALRTPVSSIPILSRRRARVMEALGAEPGSHIAKVSAEAFDSLPVEFLFSLDLDPAIGVVQRIVQASENPQVEVCIVPDPPNRSFFVSVILPRPLYDESLRQDFRDLLTERHGASYIDSRTTFLDDEVALIHFFCTSSEDIELEGLARLEREVRERATRWQDRFETALLECTPSEQAYRLADQYQDAFPEEYRVVTCAEDSVQDVEQLERLRHGECRSGPSLRADLDAEGGGAGWIKIYQSQRPYLTDLLPVLDNFGLRVIDATLTEVQLGSEDPLWIVTFRLTELLTNSSENDLIKAHILSGLHAVLHGRVENDRLNRLILGVGVSWQQVEVLRAYVAYARQLDNGPDRGLVCEILLNYPRVTRALLQLFRARFEPDIDSDRASMERDAASALMTQREGIRTADEDRVFDLLANLVASTVRTSFFTRAPDDLENLTFKISPKYVKSMPSPKPYAEIFVHGADMIGLHLRGGLLARGGIRWSDRVQELRAEILGLMKTQMTKNGLIVPTGAKGGFALKRRVLDPARRRVEAERQYPRFMKALLGITDNVIGDRVVPPHRVVRHDGDDPYLVVAADKGTAHLSDSANEVAREADFWLGDAFASGGSEGFVHKREGITARGAWVCVERHFMELGLDMRNESFTMVGIGDMSGDVFGNGVLLAQQGRLLAAFNHLHIFVDPDPDARARLELKRLFDLPESSWCDYSPKRISKGGGVFERTARVIPLTPQMRQVLEVDETSLSGEEVIRAILRMRVELLWNGGIGTYVKASHESNSDLSDRANASVRIDASELRARVVGEGGNLGLTQLARIEYELGGGRINTDAIDNSGGVDLSDHEVNFKILLARPRRQGRLSLEERNEALRQCVKEADTAVLLHNAAQSRCLSMDLIRGREDPGRMLLATGFLERNGGLERALEFLPERDELHSRAGLSGGSAAYTRAELAILLGYTKTLAKRAIVDSPVPDRPCFSGLLRDYFPKSLAENFAGDIREHRLRREITATCLINRVIDRAGVTLLPELVQALGASVPDVISAAYTVSRLLDADQLHEALEAAELPESLRLQAALRIEEAVRAGTRVLLVLERCSWLPPEEFAHWQGQVRALGELVLEAAQGPEVSGIRSATESWVAQGLGTELACGLARLPSVCCKLGAIPLARRCDASLARVVRLHSAVGATARISWLLERLAELERRDDWDRLASEALQVDMLEVQRTLTERALVGADEARELQGFGAAQAPTLAQIEQTVAQIEAREGAGLAPLTVLSQQIRRLC